MGSDRLVAWGPAAESLCERTFELTLCCGGRDGRVSAAVAAAEEGPDAGKS